MADRTAQRHAAPAPGSPDVRASTTRTSHDTARIALHGGSGQLPGWFWGALGCLSVLAAGFAVLFFLGKPGAVTAGVAGNGAGAASAPGAAPAGGTSAPAGGAANGSDRAGIQVEQLAPPTRPDMPKPPVKARAAHAIKVAHSSAPRPGGSASTVSAGDGTGDNVDSNTEDDSSDDDDTAASAPAKAPPVKTASAKKRAGKAVAGRPRAPAADDSQDDSSDDSP